MRARPAPPPTSLPQWSEASPADGSVASPPLHGYHPAPFEYPQAARPAARGRSMRRPIVAGNWKMHGSRTENARLIEELLAHCPAQPAAACVVCPPFVYLQEIGRMVRGSVLSLGGQDVCADAQGAFTGEVSAAMLKDVGCEYVIVGHSERRLLYRESDQLVARKFGAAHAKGLVPILCVGEQLADRDAGRTHEAVARPRD